LNRAQRQNCVITGNIHPICLAGGAGAEVKADPNVGIVRASHGYALVLGRVLNLINVRTVPKRLFSHVLGAGIIRYVPIRPCKAAGSSQDRLPYPCGACDEMTAAAGHAGCRAVIAARNTAMEKIVRQNEGSSVSTPATAAAGNVAAPRRILRGAVTDTSVQRTVVVTLPEAQTRSRAYGINA
jgi:hypothetical protein